MAVIKLDNITVGQTSWKPCSQQAWDQRFSIDLDKSRELEIGVYWRDWRSLCAVKFLRLEEFIDDIRHGMALQLEPTGLLFAEIKFLNPMISRKPKLQRQRMIFNKQAKNIPRAKQMNINIATWGRLLKRSNPSASNQQQSAVSTPTSTHPAYGNGSGPQPVQLIFDSEQAETPGENPDANVVGLSGARPLGIMGISALPESPAPPPAQPRNHQAQLPAVPAKPQKKPPAVPPKMDHEVSCQTFLSAVGRYTFFRVTLLLAQSYPNYPPRRSSPKNVHDGGQPITKPTSCTFPRTHSESRIIR